ncbi:tetratricopeptide repeat protein [Magnetospirillum aberrantis SpK]|uniref:Tetratricopeptide repeat protein n=2 Tax=Magnetospirillum TaxID=13134 RepID=A0A7C9V1H7_9PROT|nr:tetratricopeptide repeat protein [Magnetospirillum aberrantis SpK]
MQPAQTKTVAEIFAEAMAAYEDGRGGEAKRLAKKLTEVAPKFGGAHYLMGLLSLDSGQGKRAVDSLARAIAITPGQTVLHLAMGQALEMSGDVAEAALHYRTVLTLDPAHAEAHARLGALLGRQGRRDQAIEHCRAAIAASPVHAEALNCLGALLTEAGRPGEACDALRRALDLRPDWPAALNNFGLALRDCGRLDAAATILEGAVDLRPDQPGMRANLASVYRAQNRLDDARKAAEDGTRVAPRSLECWMELGLIRQAQDHFEGAAAAFERVTALAPRSPRGWYCLGEACRRLGENARAARAYGKALKLDERDLHGAALGLALVGGGPVPDKAPEAYVRQLFDDYADRFDQSLVDKLEYCAPQLLADALARTIDRRGGLDIMDAGCGTGLAAPVLKPYAKRLDGVDLSPAMVARADERGLYDELLVGELVETLLARPERYDLLVAADVLVYLGDLGPVMQAARVAVRAGGAFAFTVEKTAESGSYVLGAKQRYAHAADYVAATAAEAGFSVALMEDAVTRRDGGNEVPGLVVVLKG